MKNWQISLLGIIFLFLTGQIFAADYKYDELHRLIEVKYNSGQVISYDYDDGGNLKSITPTKTPNTNTPTLDLSASSVSEKWQVNQSIHFQAIPQNYPSNVTIQEYQWDFDNNGSIDQRTSSADVNHSYTTAGAYTAKVTIDYLNTELSATQSFTIESMVVPPQKGSLNLTLAQSSLSEGNSINATVAFDRTVDHVRSVSLSPSPSGQVSLPSSVIIPANQRQQSFSIQAIDNSVVDGNRNTRITASSSEAVASVQTNLTVLDNDTVAQGLEVIAINLNGTNVVEANTSAKQIEVRVQNNTDQILYGITVNVTAPDVLTFTEDTSCGGSGLNIAAHSSKRCFISRIEIDDFVAPGAYSLSVTGSDQTGSNRFTKSLNFTVENPYTPDFQMHNQMKVSFSRDPGEDVSVGFIGQRHSKGYWEAPTLMKMFMQKVGSDEVTELTSEFFNFRVNGSNTKRFNYAFKAPAVPGDYRIWSDIFPSVDSNGSNNASSASVLTVNDPDANKPVIDSVSPLSGLLGQLSNFVVTGENLSNIVFSLDDCSGVTAVTGSTAIQRTFSCTPSNTDGTKQGLVEDDSGKPLKSFAVEILKPVASEPVISIASGEYSEAITVELSNDDILGASIYYTLDGSVPTASSLRYTSAITLDHSVTLKAVAISNGYINSRIVSVNYVIDINKVQISNASAKTVADGSVEFSAIVSLHDSVVNPTYSFEYGLSPALGQSQSVVYSPETLVNGTLLTKLAVTELVTDKTIFYRLKVVADGETYLGSINKFVVAGECSYRNWETVSIPNNTAISALAYGNGTYVAVASSKLLLSTDGNQWSDGFSLTGGTFYDVIWNGSQFLLTSSNQKQVFISEDGVSWEVIDTQLTEQTYSVAWDGRQYVAVGVNGIVATSANGKSWVTQSSGTSEILIDVEWLDSQFIAVGTNGAIISSPDGVAWFAETLVTSDPIVQIAGNANNRVVAVGLPNSTVNLYSQQGSGNWTSTSTSQGARLIWDDLHYYVPGTDHALISQDGNQWVELYKPSDRKITGLIFDGEYVYLGDETGGIQRSRCGVPAIPVVNVDVSVPVTELLDAFVATIVVTGENLPDNINIETQNCTFSRGTQYDSVTKEWSDVCTTLVSGIYTGSVTDADTGEVLKAYQFELIFANPVVHSVTNEPAEITVGDDVVFIVTGEHLRVQTSLSIDGFVDCNPFNGGGAPPPVNALPQLKYLCHADSVGTHQGLVQLDTDLIYGFTVDVLEDVDPDKDGVTNDVDNCPLIANADQLNTDSDTQGNACDDDDDNDGLTDSEEAILHTNPLNADTDADGVNDGADKYPLDNTESTDTDNDSVGDNHDNCPVDSNIDQANNDEDEPGDVCDSDDDNDGMLDTWEDQYGLDSKNPADANLDGDNDSFTNKEEFDAGTNPTDSTSHPSIPISEYQQISMSNCSRVAFGQVFRCDISYSTTDNNSRLSGLGFGFYYDATKLEFLGIENILAGNLFSADIQPANDVADDDNDSSTSEYISTAWLGLQGTWPDQSLPTRLLTVVFKVNDTVALGDTTTIQFSPQGTAEGYGFESDPKTLTVVNGCTLDIDGDGQTKPLTDGLILLRYLFNFRDDPLINNALGAGATRADTQSIGEYIDGCKTDFDIDGTGNTKPLTDGLITLRYLFNFRDDPLINNAIGSGAVRNDAASIIEYLDQRR